MCGIAGIAYFSTSSSKVSKSNLEMMGQMIRHRGPNGYGSWISSDERIGFVHARLSVIDLSSQAGQPMKSSDGRYHIVFNGEIYNHQEIREELKKIGVTHWNTSHSDTEVLLNALIYWGIDAVKKLRGMFAFVFFDEQTKDIYFVRDRVGIKPLYYTLNNNRIAFASEIKSLLKAPEVKVEFNRKLVGHYLSFLTTPAPETFFKDIYKLPPATWLKIDGQGQRQQKSYWDPLDQHSPMRESDVNEAELVTEIKTKLNKAVEYRMIADIPIGVFLSGGLDSSLITGMSSEFAQERLKTFTIGYEGNYESYTNESRYAKMMSEKVGSEHFEKFLKFDDFIKFLPHMIYLQDEPIADPVCFPVFAVSELAIKNKVSVCLVGEGADELFFGYPAWKMIKDLDSYNSKLIPSWVKKGGLFLLEQLKKDHKIYYEWLRRASDNKPLFWGGADIFHFHEKDKILTSSFKNKFGGVDSWDVIKPYFEDFQNKTKDPSPENWMAYLDIRFRLPELLLMRVDKMSMAVALEARVPFLDHKLVEFSFNIPSQMKTKNNELKYLLKKSAKDIVPDELVYRKKQGFAVPIHEWLMNHYQEPSIVILKRFCTEEDIFEWSAIEEMMNKKQWAKIWHILNLALWWKLYIKNETV